MNAPQIRQSEVIAKIIATDDADEAEELTWELNRAPRNRRELRETLANLPRAAKRHFGFGTRHNEVRFGGTA